MKRPEIAIMTVAIALVTGLAGFGIGRATAGKTLAANTAPGGADGQSSFGGGGGQSGFGGGMRRGGRPVSGTVASLAGSTLVITDSAGTAHNVTLSDTTAITSGDGSTAATKADLTAGTKVAAIGSAATDGSVSATRVIINPAFPSGAGAPPADAPAGGSQAN